MVVGVRPAHDVHDRAVLNVAPAPDPDAVHVAADHGIHPDAARLANLDVADDLGALVHVRRLVHHRKAPLIAPKHL